jgi:hypothetical protein
LITFATQEFGIELDWSDESIRHVERIAAVLHDSYKGNTHRPS